MLTELILSPSKVTCTCTVPLEVLIAVPWTTFFEDAEGVDEDPDDAPDDEVAVGVGVGGRRRTCRTRRRPDGRLITPHGDQTRDGQHQDRYDSLHDSSLIPPG
jgi:hypothetical protein